MAKRDTRATRLELPPTFGLFPPSERHRARRTWRPEDHETLYTHHEQAYLAGWQMAIRILEAFLAFRSNRPKSAHDSKCFAHVEYLRGMLDALMPMLGDTVPLLRQEVAAKLRRAIIDDVEDCAAIHLNRLRGQQPVYELRPERDA